jgi:hypothetical protein
MTRLRLADPEPHPLPSARWIDTALVTSSLLLYSFIAAPVPALNEPHYLAKAKHFWQPEWCAGDFFLESANAHTVFFVTVGWLTTVCSLTAAAIVGRVLALSVLAWGWTALARSLGLSRLQTVLSVWLFLALATCGNWSGEWLVGGVESKVFAYGCLFWAWSLAMEWRWYRSALAMGAAIAFHPVVGLWGLMATVGALVWMRWHLFRDPEGSAPPPLQNALPSGSRLNGAIAIVIVFVSALPGLVPVLHIMLAPLDATTRYAGTYIQVYYRLGHHLDPMLFPLRAYTGYAALAVVWSIGWKFGLRGPGCTWLHRLTAWALLFALAGLAIGWGPRPPQEMPGYEWRMHLLKFYPFRLADVILPLTVAMLAATVLARWLSNGKVQIGMVTLLAAGTLLAAHQSVQDQRYTRAQAVGWREACGWIREHTPRDAMFLTPHGQWTFKWYAERAEFTNFKDCPQDVRGIVEWNRRQRLLTQWYQDQYADGRYSQDELEELGQLTGSQYLIVDELGPIDAASIYQNATHRVYDLREDRLKLHR